MKNFVLAGMIASVFLMGNILISAPKNKKVKKTESQKMADEINRIEKRVQEIQGNIESYKKNDERLDELEKKLDEANKDLN